MPGSDPAVRRRRACHIVSTAAYWDGQPAGPLLPCPDLPCLAVPCGFRRRACHDVGAGGSGEGGSRAQAGAAGAMCGTVSAAWAAGARPGSWCRQGGRGVLADYDGYLDLCRDPSAKHGTLGCMACHVSVSNASVAFLACWQAGRQAGWRDSRGLTRSLSLRCCSGAGLSVRATVKRSRSCWPACLPMTTASLG